MSSQAQPEARTLGAVADGRSRAGGRSRMSEAQPSGPRLSRRSGMSHRAALTSDRSSAVAQCGGHVPDLQ
jgi:hypothetical protein